MIHKLSLNMSMCVIESFQREHFTNSLNQCKCCKTVVSNMIHKTSFRSENYGLVYSVYYTRDCRTFSTRFVRLIKTMFWLRNVTEDKHLPCSARWSSLIQIRALFGTKRWRWSWRIHSWFARITLKNCFVDKKFNVEITRSCSNFKLGILREHCDAVEYYAENDDDLMTFSEGKTISPDNIDKNEWCTVGISEESYDFGSVVAICRIHVLPSKFGTVGVKLLDMSKQVLYKRYECRV